MECQAHSGMISHAPGSHGNLPSRPTSMVIVVVIVIVTLTVVVYQLAFVFWRIAGFAYGNYFMSVCPFWSFPL